LGENEENSGLLLEHHTAPLLLAGPPHRTPGLNYHYISYTCYIIYIMPYVTSRAKIPKSDGKVLPAAGSSAHGDAALGVGELLQGSPGRAGALGHAE